MTRAAPTQVPKPMTMMISYTQSASKVNRKLKLLKCLCITVSPANLHQAKSSCHQMMTQPMMTNSSSSLQTWISTTICNYSATSSPNPTQASSHSLTSADSIS